jgi:uncharacterized repeat protein (TIGR01451 family)
MNRIASKMVILIAVTLALLAPVAANAAVTLTIAPVSWNVIGLDSNTPATGPGNFPVGARVCSSVATTNVAVNYIWDSVNPFIDLRAGSLTTITIPAIGAGQCKDAYFEVSLVKTAAAFDTTRRYHITATDVSGTISTATPREIYVEHLISQNRNSISDVKFGPTIPSLVSVPAGGAMDLVVGNTYVIQLIGGTATQGYNQFEAFINFPNTIFQVLSVSTTYSADNSPNVPNPNDKLYADACLWENDPNSPNYLACVGGDFKAGGSTVITTYTIQVLSGGGSSQPLNTLLYDFSGSSFHYNADFTTGARIANVIDPASATIAKSFSPNPAPLNGISALTITLTNPNAGTLGGYNFVDNLPANLVVANPPLATTSGCGAPTLTATAGSSSISFSNGTLAANSNCVIKVNVTPTATGSLVNTTNHLFVGTTDTGHSATATLTVNTAPPPGTGLCGLTLAKWTFPTGFTLTSPAPSTNNVGTAQAEPGPGLSNPTIQATNSSTTADGTSAWGSNGAITTGATLVTANDDYYEFAFNTTGVSSVTLSFDALRKTPNGPAGLAVFFGTTTKPAATSEPGAAIFNNSNALPSQNTWATFGSITVNSGLNPSGLTFFRIYPFNSGNTNSGSDSNIDNVTFTGCTTPAQPAIAKAFAPSPVAVNGVSTLTFTLTNPNAAPLTGAAFTDALPSGVQVAGTPAASTTCGGAPIWAPATAATSLTFSGGIIPASGSCTVSVNVTATSAGPHGNVSGTLSTTESGTNISSVGSANLTALVPPSIAKGFNPTPILAGGVSTLTFTIINPNQNDAISGVAFSDTLPVSPGAMKVGPSPSPTTSGCGSPTFSPVAGAGAVSFTGGAIAPGSICTVSFQVTAPAVGTYNNTSGPVSYVINSVTVNGNTASASLTTTNPNPSISLLKQISLSASGPWTNFLPLSAGPVFYRFTLENTGDVPLNPISITDNTIDVSTCNASFSGVTLPVAVPANDNHIITCVAGPVAITPGSHTNTAHATGTFSGTPHDSASSSATFATTGLTLDKTSVETTYLNAGDTIHYNYLVTNSGFAPLQGPVTVADNKATVTCPVVSTVGDLDNFLDPGESITCTATYIITGTDVSNASVTNTATATVQGVNSNPDSVTIFLATSADVSVVKTLVTAGPFTSGQSISYTLFIANAGPSTATNINVTDTPTNLLITSVTGACVALPCTIASIASGGNATITVTATINAPGAFDNSATVSATQPDPNPGNNTDNTGNGGLTGASADVSVVKTLVTAGPFTVGQIISYTLFVANAGPSTATNIQVTDTPANLSITNVSGSGCAALPCTIASLASGANTTINVTATITAAGSFDNSSTVSATEPDPNPGNNTDNTGNGGTAAASADMSVVKTLTTSGPFTDGQSITFTLLVANGGPSTATNIQVTDTPSNLTITNVTGGGCSALPCTIASLASGANVTITVTATIASQGAFNNSATVSANESDPNIGNNTDNTGNGGTAAPSADVSVVKTLITSGPFVVGQSITYTLFVANAGPSTATNVNVTDTPTNLNIIGVTGGGCAALPCTLASLASGANATITVTATITAVGAFDNSATVSATEPDPNPVNNTDNTGNGGTAVASADVSVVKTLLTSGPFNAGQSISYTLVVANAGPSTATNVQVTDTPTNLTITNVSGSGCAALPCTIASIASGANTTINVTATITSVGSFDNSATATATEPDPNPGNNTDGTGNGGITGASADVSVVKTLTSAGPFSNGQSISYTIVVANAGPSTATNIQITDTPTHLTITNVSGGGCAALPCTIASLASGANVTINVTATINAAGAFDNSATATATEPDPNPGNNTDNTGNGGTAPSADVLLVKTLITAGPFTNGQSISYTIVVANAGPSTATNIQVTDTPTHLTITSVTGGGCAALPCTIASLASGANVTINVTATINAAGAFDNSATATATEPDPNPANNTDNTGNGGTTGATSADLAIVKTGPATQPVEETSFDYTLVVTNNGPSTATGVVVSDPLPSNFTLGTATPTQGSCSGTTTVTCNLGTILNGATATITIHGTGHVAGVMANTATVSGNETDPVPANNSSTATVLIVEDVPTMSGYALMLLALTLAIAAAIAMKSQH